MLLAMGTVIRRRAVANSALCAGKHRTAPVRGERFEVAVDISALPQSRGWCLHKGRGLVPVGGCCRRGVYPGGNLDRAIAMGRGEGFASGVTCRAVGRT